MVTIKLLHKVEGRKYKRPFSFLSKNDAFVEKSYQVPYLNARAMREIDSVSKVVEKVAQDIMPTREEIDACCAWFIGLFQNQFTLDELLDGYPADSLMPDIIAAYRTVCGCMTKVLTEFPLPEPTAETTM